MGRHSHGEVPLRFLPVWYKALLAVVTALVVPAVLFLEFADDKPSPIDARAGGFGCLDTGGCLDTPAAAPTAAPTAVGGTATAATRVPRASRGAREILPDPVTVPLGARPNNDGITASGKRTAGFDGTGYSFPQQALPAGRTSVAGVPYRLLPGADNMVARGQTVPLPRGRYRTMRVLAAASYGPAGGAATVRYAAGPPVRAVLTAPDWVKGGAGALRAQLRNTPDGGTENRPVNIYALSVPLDPGRTLSSVTLPLTAAPDRDAACLHIFAITLVPGQ